MKISLWLYRQMLKGYPTSFRQHFGEEMEGVFVERWRENAGIFPFWQHILTDWLTSLYQIHTDQLKETGMNKTWLLFWILASIIGWAIGYTVGYPHETTPMLIPLGGVVTAIFHLGLLYFIENKPTIITVLSDLLLHTGGWLAGIALLAVPQWTRLTEQQLESTFLSFSFFALILVGGLQTLALRPKLRLPALWLAVPFIGVFIGLIFMLPFNMLVVANRPPSMSWFVLHTGLQSIFGLIYGIVTGLALWILWAGEQTSSEKWTLQFKIRKGEMGWFMVSGIISFLIMVFLGMVDYETESLWQLFNSENLPFMIISVSFLTTILTTGGLLLAGAVQILLPKKHIR